MTAVWAASPERGRVDFEPVTAYVNLRVLRANIQTDSGGLDLREYGNAADGMVKLRFEADPGLSAGDMIYLTRPQGREAAPDGAQAAGYGRGDYEVVDVKGGFWRRTRNPFTVRARAVLQ